MRRLLVSLVTAGLVAAACSEPTDDRGGSVRYAKDGTFTLEWYAVTEPFDPYRSGIWNIAYLAYDPLVNLRPDGEFVSGLAEEWTADARSATFTLREDVTCSDGTPLTASQVAAAINYVSNPENGSTQYGFTTPLVPLTATGDDATRVVEVVTEQPFGFLLHTIGQLPIVCANGLKNPDILASGSDGTGPFVLTDVDLGQSFMFTRRDDYTWGPGGASTSAPGTPAKVVVRSVTDETTRANLLLSGELSLAGVSGENRQRLDAQGLEKIEVPGEGYWLWFNEIGGRPAADRLVRQALVQALDLDEVITVSTGAIGSAASGLTTVEPRACPGDTVAGLLPEHDVAAAERLLDEAGWIKGSDGIRRKDGEPLALDLVYPSEGGSGYKPAAELLANRWEAIGVQVKITGVGNAQLGEVVYTNSDFDVFTAGFGASLPSNLTSSVSGPVPPDGGNFVGIDNEEYNALVAEAERMTLPESCTYWNQADQALVGDLNPAPLADLPSTFYLKNAQAQFSGLQWPVPTSIRVLE